MPPVLDKVNSKVDGLAFLGLSLARNHYYGRGEGKDGEEGGKSAGNHNDLNETQGQRLGHPDSYTHQTAFDLNKVIDRDYEFLQATDDNGWLVGGGEAGPPTSYKLPLLDSAHVEILRVGTYRKDWGGIDLNELLQVMNSGSILIPQIEVIPTDVVANPDLPPELEIRFDMEEAMSGGQQLKSLELGDFESFCRGPLPINWQLRFLHNQFFKTFIYPSRFCPGAFHSTILRKADFRSDAHRAAYFDKCTSAINAWRREGPKPLNTIPRHPDTRPLSPGEVEALKEVRDSDKFNRLLAKQNSNDTDFVPPTAEEEDAVAELVEKLADMAPLPPVATTAKATTNLEVALDEESSIDDDDLEADNNATGAEIVKVKNTKEQTEDKMAPTGQNDLHSLKYITIILEKSELKRLGWSSEAFNSIHKFTLEPEQVWSLLSPDKAGFQAEAIQKIRKHLCDYYLEKAVLSSFTSRANILQVVTNAPLECKTRENHIRKLESVDDLYSAAIKAVNEPRIQENPKGDTLTIRMVSPTSNKQLEVSTEMEKSKTQKLNVLSNPDTPTAITGLDALSATSEMALCTPSSVNSVASMPPTAPEDCHSGIWLFTDRANITHFFAPNFLPPYDTPEKRRIIFDVLKEEWDEGTLSWKPCGHGSFPKKPDLETKKGKRESTKKTTISDIFCAFMDGCCCPR